MFLNSKNYKLEKAIWTDSDFEKMGWHDSNVYAISFLNSTDPDKNEFCLDLDYIFEWINPEPPEKTFSFWVSPCTLIFHNVFDLKINIESGLLANLELEIADIFCEESVPEDKPHIKIWKIELQSGDIQFQATGFKQIVRKKPIYKSTQNLTLSERGGISFDQKPYK